MVSILWSVVREWLRDSWSQYDVLAHSSDADAAGVQVISGVMFHPTPSPVNIHTCLFIFIHHRLLHVNGFFPGDLG